MENLLLAIDIGTSGCKITIFNYDGAVVASDTGKYKTYYPAPNCVEQDPNEWWEVICSMVNNMLTKNNINSEYIKGIGLDGHSWACLPIDKQGNCLRNCMLWLDRRSSKQAEWMKTNVGEKELIELSGNPVDSAYIVPKMLWMQENEKDLYDKTYKFLQSQSFIGFKLTGEVSQEYSQGYGFHFFDIKNGCYNEEMANKLHIDLDKVVPLVNSHSVIGTVTNKAANETGLKSGTPVVAGGLDAACCTLGAGVIEKGQTQEQGGQAGGMSICLDEPLIHPKLILGYHVVPNSWLLQGGTVGGGGTLNWFNRELGYYEKCKGKELEVSSFEIMSEEAESIQVGSDGLIFLPYMAGERSPIWDNNARGVYFGLSFDKTRNHMIRSTMEGVAYSLLHNLETAEEVDAYVDKLISVGGSANSEIWTQIKADITGKTIEVPMADYATSLGAALLAGVGIGAYKDFEEAVNRTVRIKRTHLPNKDNYSKYKNYYKIYRNLYSQLKPLYDDLNSIN